jgi:hypothetical protein
MVGLRDIDLQRRVHTEYPDIDEISFIREYKTEYGRLGVFRIVRARGMPFYLVMIETATGISERKFQLAQEGNYALEAALAQAEIVAEFAGADLIRDETNSFKLEI